MRTVLVQVEALSDGRSESLVECAPAIDAKYLWAGLATVFTLITYSRSDEEKVKYWLDREAVTEAVKHLTLEDNETLATLITQLRAQGHEIEVVWTSNEQDATNAMVAGCSLLRLRLPVFKRSEFVEPPHVEDWTNVIDLVERQRVKLAEDKRLKARD